MEISALVTGLVKALQHTGLQAHVVERNILNAKITGSLNVITIGITMLGSFLT